MPYAERLEREKQERQFRSENPGEFARGQMIREQYARFIQSYQWDDFLTVTFRQPRKEPYYAAQSVWHVLEQRCNAVRSFLCVEPHQSGDLHIHGLISGLILVEKADHRSVELKPGLLLPWQIWDMLYHGDGVFKGFGRSKVEACNNLEAVSMYCAKYLLKQQNRVADYYYVFGDPNVWKCGLMN